MFIPDFVNVQSNVEPGPQACRPFTLQSTVCVGDLIAIVACSISGIGFFFWSIHAIRKMRQFSSIYKPADIVIEEEPNGESGRPPFYVPSASDDSQRLAQTLTLPERVETRLALSRPNEYSYRLLPPIVTDTTLTTTTPRVPPCAGGQSRSSSCHSSRQGSPLLGGSYAETYAYEIDDGDFRSVSPSRARGSLPRRSGSDRGDYQSLQPINPDPVPYISYHAR